MSFFPGVALPNLKEGSGTEPSNGVPSLLLWLPNFPPSTRRAGSRRDYSSNPFSKLLRGCFNLEGKSHCRHLESRKAVRRGAGSTRAPVPLAREQGRQPWPPVRAHSPDKLPVALRSKHSRQLAAVAAGRCLRLCLRQRVSCYPFAAKRSTTESEILAATCFPPQTGLGIL